MELLELEKVTVECIEEILKTIQDTNGKPFNPRSMIHLLIENILAILVINTVHISNYMNLLELTSFIIDLLLAIISLLVQSFAGILIYNVI